MRLLTIPMSHYCEKARWSLDQIMSFHERYWKVLELINEHEDMARAFDDMRRSTARLRLLGMHSLSLLT